MEKMRLFFKEMRAINGIFVSCQWNVKIRFTWLGTKGALCLDQWKPKILHVVTTRLALSIAIKFAINTHWKANSVNNIFWSNLLSGVGKPAHRLNITGPFCTPLSDTIQPSSWIGSISSSKLHLQAQKLHSRAKPSNSSLTSLFSLPFIELLRNHRTPARKSRCLTIPGPFVLFCQIEQTLLP